VDAENSAGRSSQSSYAYAITSTTSTQPTKAITQFRFADFSVNGTINGPNISITVPNIVNLTTLVPTIVHNGSSISPASGVAQDFSNPIQYTVTASDNSTQNYTVTVTVTNTTLATAFTWINNNYQYGRTYTVVAQSSASLVPVTIDTSSSVNIILSGGSTEKTISLSSNGSLFTIRYGTLTLDNNITLQGRRPNNASLIRLDGTYGYSNLVMNAGAKIIDNTVTVDCTSYDSVNAIGGAVKVEKNCTFTMNGGTISGNTVVAINSSSSIYSGTTPRAVGGGVYVENTGNFIMNNGTISNNGAYSAKFPTAGGGVYAGPPPTISGSFYLGDEFIMNGGTISGNTASSSSVLATSSTYGGGVAAWYGKFTMKGGTISGNTVTTADICLGGGVHVLYNTLTNFIKTGGTIYGSNASPTYLQNTAKNTNSGHAVYVSASTSTTLIRNTTAGISVNLDSSRVGSAGGWE
jgi:hypothetical protein